MATRKEYIEFVLSALSPLGQEVTCRPMMGEFVLYYRDKVVGGIYDDRLLLKPVPAACSLLPGASRVSPYPGAKELLLVDALEEPELLCSVLRAMYPELPFPRKRCK